MSTRGRPENTAHETLCPYVLPFPVMRNHDGLLQGDTQGKSSRTIESPNHARFASRGARLMQSHSYDSAQNVQRLAHQACPVAHARLATTVAMLGLSPLLLSAPRLSSHVAPPRFASASLMNPRHIRVSFASWRAQGVAVWESIKMTI
jgi:hypothetical protein